ncbi:hypothetical protein TKK_0000799 [Trichogramma kaykai]
MESIQRIQATTTAITDKFIYTWTIENYRVIKTKVGEFILSPKFSVESDGKKYFELILYPEGEHEESAGFISIYLRYLGTDAEKKPDQVICRGTVSVINDKKVICQEKVKDMVDTSLLTIIKAGKKIPKTDN